MTSVTAIATAGCASHKTEYPAPPTDSSVADNYFGTVVTDPYRPLENDTAPATLEWVKAENVVTEEYLSKVPFRENIRKRLTDLNNFPKTGLPSKKEDGKYYYYDNDGLQNQSVLYRTDSLKDKGEVFLDPNKLSDDGTVALKGISMSNDGKYTAYIVSRSGSDWNEIFVMDTATGRLLDDHIEWAKFTGADWEGDGFYYSAYPRPEKGKEFSNANENHQIYYHKIGTPQSSDRLAYEDPKHPLHFHSALVPESEDMLFVIGGGEGIGNSLMVKNLKNGGNWIVMDPSQDFNHDIMEVSDGKIYIKTNWGAKKNRLMVADAKSPQRENWKELIPEGEGVMTGMQFAGDKMIVTYEKDASDHAYIYSLDGKQIKEIEFPTFGSVSFSSDKDSDEVFYSLSSFVYPSTRFSYNMETGESTILGTPEINGFNPDDYVTEQVFYPSADGTKIPMFITYKKGLKRDGNNPVYLYGYGGFNVSLPPGFSANRLLWLENGGIYAQANLRGGSEYGEEWHLAGTKQQKMNVFNDFIAAAEYMIKEGWTKPELLTIEGGSNGGLLVGATVNLRPDLFKVAIPRVGVMDMMRYHLFTIGWNWASDYGTSADSKEMADYLLSYSPLHNIKNDGTPYPAILITTADHDDRVVPAHSFKYAATLQAANTGDAPKLIRIDSKAGHGAGKPIGKIIDEYTDIYSFIYKNLGITPATAK
ncbi:MAG: prolyl oligopeptidase family serine peptidase [Muribaculaceae bacterium]|nr:prolyl oligopeptidase family serine peptidase [Muribaculaceae bacterium]